MTLRGLSHGQLFDEAAGYVEVIRRLWDSGEDDAEIRDVATGRFVDRDKLHYIDFAGEHFSVRGPSITPRPPQGARLDEIAGEEYVSDAAIFTGSPARLADLLQEWHEAGLSGFRLRPGVIPDDLEAVTRELVPELQRRGALRTSYRAGTLRGLLGLPRPANRYATSGT